MSSICATCVGSSQTQVAQTEGVQSKPFKIGQTMWFPADAGGA